jgi:hypothetical protein
VAPDRSERKVDHGQRRLLDRLAGRSSEESPRQVRYRLFERAIQFLQRPNQRCRTHVAKEVFSPKRDQKPGVGSMLSNEVVNR